MKHLKTIFACLLMAVLSIGQVWATEYELVYTLDCASASSNGSQQAYGVNSTTVMAGSGVTAFINAAAGSTLVSSNATVSGSVYWAKGSGGPSGTPADVLKIGKASGPGSISFTIGGDDDITKVVVTGYVWKNTSSISVNNETAQTYGTTGESHDFLFDGFTATKTISINVTTSAVCVTEIKLFKTKSGGGSDPVAVTGVSLNKASTSIVEGKTETLVATVAPSNASDKSVSWSSDDESVATVDGGIVTAVAAGTATITVTTTDGSFTDECEVTVTEAPAAVNYEKVTEAPEGGWSGEYLIVYEPNASTARVWTGEEASNCYVEAEITAGIIAQPEGTASVTIAEMTGGYSIQVNGGTNDGKYIQNNGSSNGIKFVDAGVANTLAYENSAVTITCNSKKFRYNSSSGQDRFRYFGSDQQVIQLYKKVDGTVLPSAGLAFDAAQKLAKVAGTLTAPNLSTADGFDGTVTYASSDEAVVKVNASTGAITDIVAAGKAVITAHSEETENFREGSASYTIFVAEQAGTNEDPLTEASAKALIDDGCTLTVHVNGLVLSQNSTNFTVTLTNGFQFYKAKDLNNVAFESAYLGAGDEVTAVGALKKFSSTYELDEGCYLTFYEQATTPLTPIANDKDHPYTVAQALAFAAAPTTYDLSDHVFIQGVVYKANSFNSDNGTYNIYIKDAGTSEDDGKFEFYKCAGLYQVGEDVVPFAEGDVQEGDEVIGYGVMSYYSGGSIWQFGQPNQLVSLNRPEVAVESVELASTASVAIGKTINLSANVLPANATDKAIAWSIVSGNDKITLDNGAVTGVAEGTAVVRATAHGDNTKYADCTITVEELSVWATTYTNNVAVAHTGSGEDNGTITIGTDDPYKLVKAGASSNTGTIVVTVPVGTTDLHFHAFAWNGKTAKIQLSGVENASQTEFNIAAESGATGSGNDFTLAGDPVDQYFHVSFDAVAAETEITFSKADGSADNRFFFYGVNQVGGLALESIYVSGTASVLEYTDGQHFDPAGLSVIGHYTDDSEAEITEGITWAYDPDPLTEGTTSVSVTATAGGFTSAAFVVDGLTVAGAAPLSPWATTWTSNLDDITGSKVKFYGEETEYAALKAGSGGTAGSATLNIPAQATELHLHAYGWNSEDVTLSITAPAGVTVTPASITLNRNSGFASNSPFTLAQGSTPQTDAYYALTLSGNTDAIELTITATAGKRFLLFGVNQVGGVLPVLDHITITGTMTNTTGWKTGDNIVPEGLTVNAIYTLNNVEQTPVEVDPNDVVWSHAALVENQTEVTLTATYEGKNANKVVTIAAVETGDPTIITDPTTYLNFGSSVEKDAVVASKTITVTLKNITSATATLGGETGDDYSAFSIDDTEIVDGDVITVSVNTGTVGVYAGTVTIKDDNSETQKVITLSMTVVEPEVPETAVATDSKWVPAEAADIKDGAVVLITGVKDDVTYAIGVQNDNNRAAVAGTLDEGVFTPGENTMAFTLVAQEGGTFALRASNGEYLYAASSTKNYLKRQATIDDEAKWTLTATSAVANGTNTHNDLKFNGTNSPKIFSCYGSPNTQTAIQFYVPKPAPAPEYETVRSGLVINRYYTVCLPKKVTAIKGASFWTLHNKSQDGTTAYLEEETNNLPFAAGTPFIIQATAANLEVVYEGDATEVAGTNGALHGTLVYMNAAALAAAGSDIYMLFSNELRPVGDDNHLDANRAYVKLSDLDAVAEAPQSAPGRRVRAMPMQPQTATGIEDLNASEKPMKMMINGQIFILRGEKMYDTTGRLVK